MKNYKVEYWYLLFIGGEDLGYDFDVVNVKAISPKQAISKAKQQSIVGAKNFKIIEE